MKNITLIAFLIILCSFANAQVKTQQTFYTCVMHPEIHSPKQGNCPKCGMVLVKEKPKVIYTQVCW